MALIGSHKKSDLNVILSIYRVVNRVDGIQLT